MRAWRQCEGLRLADVASKMAISKQLLSEYERGLKLPSIRKTLEMAELLGASPAMWLRYRLQDELKTIGYEAIGSLALNKLAS
jgi:transcriptional regulator with XRE-family HTH domain